MFSEIQQMSLGHVQRTDTDAMDTWRNEAGQSLCLFRCSADTWAPSVLPPAEPHSLEGKNVPVQEKPHYSLAPSKSTTYNGYSQGAEQMLPRTGIAWWEAIQHLAGVYKLITT